MRPLNILNPWYLFRPSQFVRRVVRIVRRPASPVQVFGLPWGCEIGADIREQVGRTLWTTGVYDIAVTEVLARLTDPGCLALDVGANIGVMTSLMASRGAEVWAFEPFPETYRRLMDNIGLFKSLPHFGTCTAFELAASDADGIAQMECPGGFDANNGLARISSVARETPVAKAVDGISVRTVCLDSLLGGRTVGIMKIDVEGHELAVLRGAAKALNDGMVESIVFEEHNGPSSPSCLFLIDCGFTVLKIGWKTWGPVLAPLTAKAHRANEAPNYLATRHAEAALDRCSAPGWRCLRRPSPPGKQLSLSFSEQFEART
jgi:FkbM family methyltransferase